MTDLKFCYEYHEKTHPDVYLDGKLINKNEYYKYHKDGKLKNLRKKLLCENNYPVYISVITENNKIIDYYPRHTDNKCGREIILSNDVEKCNDKNKYDKSISENINPYINKMSIIKKNYENFKSDNNSVNTIKLDNNSNDAIKSDDNIDKMENITEKIKDINIDDSILYNMIVNNILCLLANNIFNPSETMRKILNYVIIHNLFDLTKYYIKVDIKNNECLNNNI